MNYIDLFAGAGGLSEGFIRSGFFPIAHIERDKHFCLTLKTRIAYNYLKGEDRVDEYYGYLKGEITRDELYNLIPDPLLETVVNKEITGKNCNELFESVDNLLRDFKKQSIDIIIGGPPCQAYSVGGRWIDKDEKLKDNRNYLYKLYARFLLKFKPKLFIFENVPGIRTASTGKYYRNLKKYYRKIGYNVDDKILNAADYGVLQKRKRVIIIGWKKGLNFQYPEFDTIDNKWTVKDILSDLPALMAGEAIDVGEYISEPTEYLNKFDIRNGNDFVIQHIARPHNEKDLRIYKMAIELWDRDGIRLKNSDIPAKMRTQINVKSFLDRFKVVSKNDHSHTIIAHIAKDGHYYIHPDINQLRSLSVREAARIQSFPDSYFFEGPRTSVLTQIGNAVPPLLAYSIARKFQEMLNA